jgi:hypothetical protein
MPARWDHYQNINHATGRVEWPSGPMDITKGFVPKWVEAWVVQSTTGHPKEEAARGPGSSQSTSQRSDWQPDYKHWNADTMGWANGSFHPGLALGIGLVASRNYATGVTEFDFWLDIVELF